MVNDNNNTNMVTVVRHTNIGTGIHTNMDTSFYANEEGGRGERGGDVL